MKTPRGEINDNVMELLNHPELLAQMQTATSPEECYDIIKNTISVSFEEFKDSMLVAKQLIQESESGLLTDEELDMVAGGKDTVAIIFGVGMGVIGGIGAALGSAAV